MVRPFLRLLSTFGIALVGTPGCDTSNAPLCQTLSRQVTGGGATVACAVDSTLPPEPTIPAACATLMATQAATSGATLPSENTLDTSPIQTALNSCPSGQAVKLTTNGANNAFVSGPLKLPAGVTLWVDAGTTLYASRNPRLYGTSCGTATGSCSTALINAAGANSAVMGDGVIDGQGGEMMIGMSQSWWDLSDSLRASNGSAANPSLIQATAASSNFTLYKITLHNGPKFHVRIAGNGFVVWGVTMLTPATATNSQGAPLSPYNARNTDGIDPGAGGAVSNGFIVHNKLSVGDDQIAIKGATSVTNLTIAHNHFGSGHGMSIGSETNGGVSGITVCDLTIDNSLRPTGGSPSTDVNGIRIKSDPSRGGLVNNVVYTDVCVRNVDNPLILNPMYSGNTGSSIPTYTNVTIKNFHATSDCQSQTVTLDGFDSSHVSSVNLDNVVVDGMTPSFSGQDATVTLGPGAVSFASAITGPGMTVMNNVSGAAPAVDCSNRWVAIP